MNDLTIPLQPSLNITSDVEIDDMLLVIAAADEQIEQYKALKKYRVKPIDEEILKLEEKKEMYRSAIKQFMSETNEKALKYPGVGKISFRNTKGKWQILDEAKLLTELKAKLNKADHDKIVQYVLNINKTELNKVLDAWEASSEIPKGLVVRDEETSTITITLEKTDMLLEKVHQKKNETLATENVPKSALSKAESEKDNGTPLKAKVADFDGLDF